MDKFKVGNVVKIKEQHPKLKEVCDVIKHLNKDLIESEIFNDLFNGVNGTAILKIDNIDGEIIPTRIDPEDFYIQR